MYEKPQRRQPASGLVDSSCISTPGNAILSPHDLFSGAEQQPFHDLHYWRDPANQLQAIIAIHSSRLGPALGGCRFMPYPSSNAAQHDALQLARSMSYKCAIHQLPFGGGKAVILRPPEIHDRHALFAAFGEFIETLGGRYIAAMDAGTTVADMDSIAHSTSHVACTSRSTSELGVATGDPAPYTAYGVFQGIRAAVHHQLGQDSIRGLRIGIQGLGHVGMRLAKWLSSEGARLFVSDLDPHLMQRAATEFDAVIVAPADITRLRCDVLAPCALGPVVSEQNITQLKAAIIAGGANNQLASDALAAQLHQRGILYAPDYVINAGGILQLAYINDTQTLARRLHKIYDTLLQLFISADQQHCSALQIANQQAEARLGIAEPKRPAASAADAASHEIRHGGKHYEKRNNKLNNHGDDSQIDAENDQPHQTTRVPGHC